MFPRRKKPEVISPLVLQEQSLAKLVEGCVTVIRSAGEYAIDFETGDAHPFAAELSRLSLTLAKPLAQEGCGSLRSGMHAACKEHRDRSSERLTRLHQQTQAAWVAAQAAVGEFAEGLSTGNGLHEEGIHAQLDLLKTATFAPDLSRIRRVLEEATQGIRRSQVQLERTQRIVIVQLQDEVRVLRETMEARNRQRDRDPELDVWRREEMDRRIKSRLTEDASFAILVVSIHNLKPLAQEYCPEVLRSLLESMLKRLAGVVGPRAEIGRWTPNAFAVILPIAPALAPAVCEDVRRQVSGPYAVQFEGKSLPVDLDLSAGTVNIGDEYGASRRESKTI